MNRRRRSFWITFAASWLAFSCMAVLWSIATPVSAAPDEPAHIIKAASAARGQFDGPLDSKGQAHFLVPAYIAFTQSQTCYAFSPNRPANCSPALTGDGGRLTTGLTSAGLYNPLYYEIVGWPSLIDSNESGILWMRVISSVVCSAFLAMAFALICGWRRPAISLVGFATAVTPTSLFLAGVVNPNSLEFAGLVAAFVTMLTIVRETDARRLPFLAAVLAVSSAVVANMRGLSLLWLAVALLAPLILVRRERLMTLLRSRPIQVCIGVVAVASVAALVWLLSSNSLASSITNPSVPSTAPGVGSSPLQGFITTVLATFDFGEQLVGVFGWLDTAAPSLVYFVWAALVGGLLLATFATVRRRALLFTAVLAVAVLLLPPILEAVYVHKGGLIWQGRYILPLFACLMIGAAHVLTPRLSLTALTRTRLVAIVAVGWSLAQSFAFATALRRYAVGLDAGWGGLLHPQWTPPIPPLVLVGLFSLVSLGAAVGVVWFVRGDRSTSGQEQTDNVGAIAVEV